MNVLVHVISLLALTDAILAATTPIGEYACGNNTIYFRVTAVQNNVTYAHIAVEGQHGTPGCFSDSPNNQSQQFELRFTPTTCNIQPASNGIAFFQIRISESEHIEQGIDVLANVTCNVTSTGSEFRNINTNTTVTGDLASVGALPPILPDASLKVYQNNQEKTSVVLGDDIDLCTDVKFKHNSPYVGLDVGACKVIATPDFQFINDDGCVISDAIHEVVSGGFTYTSLGGLDGRSCVGIKAFRIYQSGEAITIRCSVEFLLAPSTQNGATDCPAAKRRRRSAVRDHVRRDVTYVLNVDSLETEDDSTDSTASQTTKITMTVLSEFVPSGLFFVSVAALSLILIVAIGVSACFIYRWRTQASQSQKQVLA